MPSKVAFQLIVSVTYLKKDVKAVKAAIPGKSGHILSHENVYFSNGNYERRGSKLQLFAAFTCLQQDCSN